MPAREDVAAQRPRIRAVLFDLGGTLVDYHDYAHWSELAHRLFVEADEEQMAHAFHEVERETDAPERPSYAEFWRRVLERASGSGVDAPTARRYIDLLRQRPGFNRLYSDSRRCLERLAAERRRLAVVSNSSSEAHVRAILHSTEILPYFERVTSSGTEGVEKPDPEIFHRTLARMKLEPADALYVGNLAFTDAIAARTAGLHSVWLNRSGTGLGDEPPEITSLLEVALWVRLLEEGTGSTAGRGREHRRAARGHRR